jgi:hypothetical protein
MWLRAMDHIHVWACDSCAKLAHDWYTRVKISCVASSASITLPSMYRAYLNTSWRYSSTRWRVASSAVNLSPDMVELLPIRFQND